MTPYEIDVLLWYHTRVEDHPDMGRCPPIWRPTIQALLEEKLLRETNPGDVPSERWVAYRISERGDVYVKALQSVPLPTASWVVVWPGPEVNQVERSM